MFADLAKVEPWSQIEIEAIVCWQIGGSPHSLILGVDDQHIEYLRSTAMGLEPRRSSRRFVSST